MKAFEEEQQKKKKLSEIEMTIACELEFIVKRAQICCCVWDEPNRQNDIVIKRLQELKCKVDKAIKTISNAEVQ